MKATSSEGFMRRAVGLFRAHRSRLAWGLLGAMVVAYLVIFGWLALRRHDALLTALDLCIYDQATWNTLHGRILRSTSEGNWEILLADYNLLRGRLCPLVLLAELAAPALAFWLCRK